MTAFRLILEWLVRDPAIEEVNDEVEESLMCSVVFIHVFQRLSAELGAFDY